jgi:hypothetical protein
MLICKLAKEVLHRKRLTDNWETRRQRFFDSPHFYVAIFQNSLLDRPQALTTILVFSVTFGFERCPTSLVVLAQICVYRSREFFGATLIYAFHNQIAMFHSPQESADFRAGSADEEISAADFLA